MLQAPEVIRQLLTNLLDSLDRAKDDDGAAPSQEERRLQLRRSFRTECKVRCFSADGEVKSVAGVTRNISFRGVAVLVSIELQPGQPIEICVDLPDQESTFLSGVVAFCRKVPRDYHEVGLRLHAGGPHPVLGENGAARTSVSQWLAEALAKVKQIALDQQ